MKSPPTTDSRCGTVAGYAAHYNRGEFPCQSCRDDRRRYQYDYYQRRKAGWSFTPITDVVADLLETWWGRRFTLTNILDLVSELRPGTAERTVERALKKLLAEGSVLSELDPLREPGASTRFVYWIPERSYLWESEEVG